MTVRYWARSTRETLRAVLPEALVVLPLGATEQHGPHLATGTDAILAATVVDRAARLAGGSRDLVLAPPLAFGASEHHLPFGGTLSLSTATATAVLVDLARSVVQGGGRRLLIVNGHGGNRGVCHAAAASASARYGIAVGVLHYWELLPAEPTPIPGHAGEFETALMLAIDPSLVDERTSRGPVPSGTTVEGVDVHDPADWLRIDGYTDEPAAATAERGRQWLERCARELAERLTRLADLP